MYASEFHFEDFNTRWKLMNMKIFLPGFFLLFVAFLNGYPQVEHNYLIGPQYTTCDSLPESFSSIEEEISRIQQAKFRFTQQIKRQRPVGVRKAHFFSCNNQTGFLILLRDDSTCLVRNVRIDDWNELIRQTDPDQFIIKNILIKGGQECFKSQ
jgi:hypothetical protein